MNESGPTSSELDSAALDVWLDFLGRHPAADEAEFERLCARRSDLAAVLRALRTEGTPRRSVAGSSEPQVASLGERMRRLRAPLARGSRYRRLGVLARGGMGVVYRMWDTELDRALAMKVIPASRLGLPGRSQASCEACARFLEEARITGQLDHPGIVPVHEIGIDEQDQLFFTMKLVEGENLRQIIELARAGEEGWNPTRVVGVLLKVCEAMSYAHSKGVIHRDLKPSNIMVGRFGEAYVMDWGVARVLGSARELRSPLASLRESAQEPLATLGGDVLGTPAYMAPEQARGGALSERTDVYALGAMLYHLLTGRVPFAEARENADSAQLLARVLAGPPRRLSDIDARIPRELRAICEQAMARRPEQRYASMLELAGELRAYLEGRVVRAQGSGPLRALAKWARRNRGLASALAAVVVVALGATLALWSWRRTQADLRLLSRLRSPSALIAASFDLWPPTPERVPAMRSWLEAAEAVRHDQPAFTEELRRLRARALPYDPGAPLELKAWRFERERTERGVELIAHYEAELVRLGRVGGTTWEGEDLAAARVALQHWRGVLAERTTTAYPRATWEFGDPTEQLLHDRLAQIGPEIEELVGNGNTSLVERVRRGAGFALDVRRRSLAEPAQLWAQARASIRDTAQCPSYQGLELVPQLGLVPIGRDPASGLWEFAHLQSGEPALRDGDGQLLLTPATGIVLVLLPAGRFHMGSQPHSSEQANFDRLAQPDEEPLQAISIDAFFLAKYEMTQPQWKRWMGANPSTYAVGTSPLCSAELHPVESVTWSAAMQAARELGLTLPTEAQWEYAARAGTETSWSFGAEPGSWTDYCNLLDERAIELHIGIGARQAFGMVADDGWPAHAPVGSRRANAFGLHDMHGNVAEWCRDRGDPDYPITHYGRTGERQIDDKASHPFRGGSFARCLLQARSAARREVGELYLARDNGLRPAREIEH